MKKINVGSSRNTHTHTHTHTLTLTEALPAARYRYASLNDVDTF